MNKRRGLGRLERACESLAYAPGDPEPLEAHRSALRSYFRRRVERPEDAEDFVQDVYLRVLAMGPEA